MITLEKKIKYWRIFFYENIRKLNIGEHFFFLNIRYNIYIKKKINKTRVINLFSLFKCIKFINIRKLEKKKRYI